MTNFAPRLLSRSKLFMAVAATASLLASTHSYAEGMVLEEIIVTAQKRAENLQDIAASLAAVSGDSLTENGVTSFKDAAKMVPGLVMKQTNATNTSISLRGLTYSRQSAAVESVDTYWNDAPYSSVAFFSSMFDVERLEVLRGPQGTLQGKTSPGGAIQLHTKAPSFDEIEGQIKTTFADDGTKIGEFGISLPLSDTLAVRIAGIYDSNEAGGNSNLLSGEEDTNNVEAGRITLAWEPSDNFDAVARYEYMELSTRDSFQMAGDGYLGKLNLTDNKGLMAKRHAVEMQTEIATLQMNWHEVGNHDITYLTSYSSTELLDRQDRDLANYTSNDASITNSILQTYDRLGLDNDTAFHSLGTDGDTYTYSSELRVDRNDDSWWQYTAGMFYAKTNNHVLSIADLQPNNGAVQTDVDVFLETEQFGYFTHNRIELSEVSELQIGLRYNRSRRSDITYQYAGKGYTLGAKEISSGNTAYLDCLYTPGALCAATPDINGQAANTSIQGQRLATLVEIQDGIADAFTGGIKYLHHLNDETMVYTSLDVSYRLNASALNPRIVEHADQLLFNEEDTTAFELGIKTTLLEGRVQLNASVYFQQLNEYQNYFKEMPLLDSGSSFTDNVVANVDAISQGVDLEVTGLISENWQASIALGYNDFKFVDGETGPCNDGTITPGNLYSSCELGGQRVGDNPNWSFTASSEYTVSLNEVDAFVRGFYQYNGWTQAPNIPGSAGRTGSYGVIDLFAGIRSKDQDWELSLWSKNLLNKVAENSKFAEETAGLINSATGYRQVSVIDERSIGASLRYSFSM